MTSALGLPIMHQNRGHAARVEKVLSHIGFNRGREGRWAK
jgi:hypothetical protein